MIVINKADGDNIERSKRTAADYRAALNILTPRTATWKPPVLTASAVENRGLDTVWAKIAEHRRRMTDSGELQAKRQEQAVNWMRDMLQERLMEALKSRDHAAQRIAELEEEVRHGRMTAPRAVDEALRLLEK